MKLKIAGVLIILWFIVLSYFNVFAAIPAKVNTAKKILVGQLIDKTDFITIENSVTFSECTVTLTRITEATGNRSTIDVSDNAVSTTATPGLYELTLTANNLGSIGIYYLAIQTCTTTSILPYPPDILQVISANIYDSLYSTGDKLQTDPTQLGGSTQSLTDLKDFVDNNYIPSTDKLGTVTLVDTTTTNSDMRGTDNAALASALVTHDNRLGTVEDHVIASGGASAAAIADAVWDEAIADHNITTRFGGTNQIGVPSANLADYKATGFSTFNPATQNVTVGTNQDKTGYALSAAAGNSLMYSILDEPLTGGTHNVNLSLARRVRLLGGTIVNDGTAAGPGTGNNQIQLNGGASSVDGAYDPGKVIIIGGTGLGQSRLIYEYLGSTKTATVDRDWKVNPDGTSEYLILPDAGREHVNEGLARGGTPSTITLNLLASSNNDTYNGQIVFIRSGTGQDQVGLITDYIGSTRIVTVAHNWVVTPDTTSGYAILPTHINDIESILANQVIAQNDLDLITGADGATLATSQPNYAPATASALTTVNNIVTSNKASLVIANNGITSLKAGVNITRINSSLSAAQLAEITNNAIYTGHAIAGTLSTTEMTTNRTEVDDHWINGLLIWTSGSLAGQKRVITDFANTGGKFTFTAVTIAPSVNDTFAIH